MPSTTLRARLAAAAQVTRLETTARQPGADGASFGADEVIRGRVHGQVDAADRRTWIIHDLDLAPRNASGRAAKAQALPPGAEGTDAARAIAAGLCR